jgi:hypothetical protein
MTSDMPCVIKTTQARRNSSTWRREKAENVKNKLVKFVGNCFAADELVNDYEASCCND